MRSTDGRTAALVMAPIAGKARRINSGTNRGLARGAARTGADGVGAIFTAALTSSLVPERQQTDTHTRVREIEPSFQLPRCGTTPDVLFSPTKLQLNPVFPNFFSSRHVATLGQGGGGSCPQMDALPQTSHLQFCYTLIFHHQCH